MLVYVDVNFTDSNYIEITVEHIDNDDTLAKVEISPDKLFGSRMACDVWQLLFKHCCLYLIFKHKDMCSPTEECSYSLYEECA